MLNNSCWVLENKERRLRAASPIRTIMQSTNISILSALTTRRHPFNIQVARISRFGSGQQTPLPAGVRGIIAERPNVAARQLSFGRSSGANCTPASLMNDDCYSPSMSVATASSMASTPAGDRSSLPWQNFLSTQPVRIGAMIAVMITAVAIWAYAVGASSA